MATQISDDELNIRRRARRRLIGAIALTLAVVVILPMVLDSEPKPSQPDIDLRIPDPEKIGEYVTSVAIPEKSTLPPVAEPAVETTEVGMATDSSDNNATLAKPETVSGKLPNPKLANPKIVAENKITPEKPASTPGAESYVAQVGAYSNASTAKSELNLLKSWGFKAYTEKSGDTIRVRIGPYTEREKAEKVGKMLEKHGLHPVILSAK